MIISCQTTELLRYQTRPAKSPLTVVTGTTDPLSVKFLCAISLFNKSLTSKSLTGKSLTDRYSVTAAKIKGSPPQMGELLAKDTIT